MLDWDKHVRPVLEAAYQAQMHASAMGLVGQLHPGLIEINEKLGQQPQDQRTATVLEHLGSAGYLDAEFGVISTGLAVSNVRLREKALQILAGWPGSPDEATASKLVELIRARAENEPDPERRSRLQKLADAAAGISRDVLTEVLAALARGQLPHGG